MATSVDFGVFWVGWISASFDEFGTVWRVRLELTMWVITEQIESKHCLIKRKHTPSAPHDVRGHPTNDAPQMLRCDGCHLETAGGNARQPRRQLGPRGVHLSGRGDPNTGSPKWGGTQLLTALTATATVTKVPRSADVAVFLLTVSPSPPRLSGGRGTW